MGQETDSISEEGFIGSLHNPNIKKKYISERRIKIRVTKSKFKSDKKFLEGKINNRIEEDKRHSAIINSCIIPFTEGPLSKTEYKFIRVAPLLELNLPNMDFLLFKRNLACNFAIFGECKGSFSNPADVIRELEERIGHIEQNKEYIITKYLNLSTNEKVHFEYVIAVTDKDAVRMNNHMLDNRRDFILWQISLTDKTGISCIFPPKSLESREKMMHKDPSLRNIFGSKPIINTTSVGSLSVGINYFPQSYEYNRINILLQAAEFLSPNRSVRIVSKANLKTIIDRDLFYMDDDFKSSQINYLVSKGLEIGFLIKSDGAEEAYYKISTNPQRSDSLERHLKAKWIKYKLEKEYEKREKAAIMEIREKFERERAQKTLFEF